MRSVDEEIWNSCINGYSCPMKTIEGKQVPKATSELSAMEKAHLQANNRALDILFSVVDVNEHHRKIANCEIAKEAWDILATYHEGMHVVKQSKLQRLTTEFESIRMQDDETFNQFYSKLIGIVNSCETLGEPIPPFRVIKKILRSLPKRFKMKVTMLEGKRKLNEKSVEEVVGLLQTYEAGMLQPESQKSKIKPSTKPIAFSSSQSENKDSESDNDYDLEAMTLFTENFKKFFKKKSTGNDVSGKMSNINGKYEAFSRKGKKGVKGSLAGPKCYDCQGYGHLAYECINKLKKKTNFKANVTWDDNSESDDSKEEQEDKSNFMVFGASL
ncbi:hypothetical protein RHGRI_008112 [Rhododendron griersonianum]|uniref:CCHC-type domain-containing protein n=1 Tax=Rhododendron griersonianum TaxID=479676 RepID=A0AAV6L087_9ERIC|nr:hypothetical protein RHGRI_008112 [Rhododendron griersonianum]